MRFVILMMVTTKMTIFWEEGASKFLRNIGTHLTTQCHTPEDSYFDFTKLSQCSEYSHNCHLQCSEYW